MPGRDWQLDGVHAPFVYQPPLDRYLRALKYRSERSLGRVLGLLLGETLSSEPADVDAVIAVPLHRARLRSRRFNQADEIGRTVAARVRRPFLYKGIARGRETRPQTELDRRQRLTGPIGSFTVTGDFSGLRLAIVDDVITTGATVNALAHALRDAGAIHIEAWAVARSVTSRE